jgi:signal transduction histidine kinase
MFRRARLRLTLLYIGLFAIALGVFAVVFYVAFANVLEPDFDLSPDLTNAQVAEAAYQLTIERVAAALAVSYVLAVALVSVAASVLASRTLKPIHEAHVQQRRFIADASHEIRTPLAAIRVTAEEAGSRDRSPEELRVALSRVVDAADGLTRLTNDLLLLARTDDGTYDRPLSSIDLSVVTAEAVDTFADANDKAHRPEIRLEPDLVVSADADEIRRIVINLVDNAIRYSGDRVSVSTSGSDREAVVEIRDSGPGIEASDLDQVFEPFYRVRADATTPDGSGLGLTIARSLALRNRGSLTVTSLPGAGATFRLALPRSR